MPEQSQGEQVVMWEAREEYSEALAALMGVREAMLEEGLKEARLLELAG